jgi:hypothetical protein
VRASAPVLSPWSLKWSFTTSLDTVIVTLNPESPAAGAREIPVKPIFQWTAIVGADTYDLLVATDADFSHPVIVKINGYSLPTNAWQCDVSLDYATTYYWKVRAIASGTSSAWSATGVFITEAAPAVNNEPPPTTDIAPTEPTPLKYQDSIVASSSSPAQPAVEQVFPPSSTPLQPSAQVPSSDQLAGIPVWIIYFVGALLAIVILVLIILLAVVLKIKRIT